MPLLLIKIKNIFTYFIHFLIFQKLKNVSAETKPNTLLLIRLDAIGDYILFRNFIEVINKSKRFNNYNVTLCGNVIWSDIAETFDQKYIKDFIWIDRNKFYRDSAYKYEILKQIKTAGFETAADLSYSREILYGDTIIRASGARVKIGSDGSRDKHAVWKRNLLSNKYYNEIVTLGDEDLFEFDRNKEFLGKIMNEKIKITKPELDVSGIPLNNAAVKPYTVIFFGASSSRKIWDIKNFINIAEYLIDNYSYNIILTGSKKEKKNSNIFLNYLPAEKLIDLCGKTTLPELSKIIAESEILISNESVAVHISASVNKKFVCITNGERFGRFHPYPKEIFDKGYYVYPGEIMKNVDKPDYLSRYRFVSDLDINSIKPGEVKEVIKQVIQNQFI
ncbi:MAG: glycosyltransferase family 9 protein [Ignavibacteriaceae bacterium]